MKQPWLVVTVLPFALLSCQGPTDSSKGGTTGPKTVITSTKVQGSTLSISGNYFGPSLTLTLGGTGLKVSSAKATEVTATLPSALAPGNYLLSVSGGTPATTDTFTVTIGAVGPPGPAGTAGTPFPPGYAVLGDSPTPPKGFTYAGYYMVSQGGPTGWTLKAPMPTARINPSVAVAKGSLFVIGGARDQTLLGLSTVEAYDPATDSWTTRAPMPTARYGAGVGVINGMLYVVGGSTKGDSFTGAFEAYDPSTNKWTAKTAIPTPKKGVVTAVANNVLYVMGDFASFSASATASAPGVEAYDPATDTWTLKAAIPTPRAGFSVGVVNNIIYAVGGTADVLVGTLEAYDPVTNTWTPKAPMPAPRKGSVAGVINGILYVAGGSNETGLLAPTYAYDPMHDSWTASLILPIPADLPGGVVTEEGIFYVIGGSLSTGKGLTSVQAFSPSGPRFYVHKFQ